MIRHIVSWKLAAEDAATKAEQSATLAASLNALVSVVPEIKSLTVASNVADIAGNWDVVLVADYDDLAGLEAYISHPEHQKVVGYIRSVVAERSAVDFEL